MTPLRHSRNLLSGIQMLLNTYGPIVEPFRGDSPFSSFPRFRRESMFLNNLDPGLKIAGVTRRWESMFLPLSNLDS